MDLLDHAAFVERMGGPFVDPMVAGWHIFDMDFDYDVDLRDYALWQASGIETPTLEDLARIDKNREKKGSNDDWRHPHDPDARITRMKDGRTHLAHKAEHAVDLETCDRRLVGRVECIGRGPDARWRKIVLPLKEE